MSSKSFGEEVRDQVLHTLVAAALVFVQALMAFGLAYAANGFTVFEFTDTHKIIILGIEIGVVGFLAWLWENQQHPGECNGGCRRDLCFWTLGALSMATLLYNY